MYKKLVAFMMAVTTAVSLSGCREEPAEPIVTYNGKYVEEEVSVTSDAFPVNEMFFYENNIGQNFNYGNLFYCIEYSLILRLL